jgi:hypothetical protein
VDGAFLPGPLLTEAGASTSSTPTCWRRWTLWKTSRPLVGFGVLIDNSIKDLMSLLSMWVGCII